MTTSPDQRYYPFAAQLVSRLALDSPVAPLGPAGGSRSSSVPVVVDDIAVSSAEELKALCLRSLSPEGGAGAAWRMAASRGDVRFEPEAILRTVRDYTSESGVGQLHARLAEVCRRRTLASGLPAVITSADVPTLLGGRGSADALPLVVRDATKVERARLVDAAALLGEAGRGPGRVVQELRRLGARNPVIVFDQLDRLSDRGGLPTALLELFDTGARQRFRDRYVDVAFDLSGASVVATAPRLRQVPSMLCERMAVVDVPGYTPEEKKEIAARHLLPAAAGLYGLGAGDVEFTDDAVLAIVRGYAPEPGFWSLLDAVRTVSRRVARRRAEGDGSKAVITPETAAAMLGTPTVIEMDVADRMGRPGVAVALGWTAYGGDVMFVEAGRMPGGGGLTLTGSLDDVLEESIRTALSWLRANARRYRLDEAVFRQTDLHVHVQSLADSRRGESAGVAVAAALASPFTGRPVRGDVALTAELTLSGHVLPVAGIKEKVLGAVRRGLTRVVLAPAERAALRRGRAGRRPASGHRAPGVAGRRGPRSRPRSGHVSGRAGRASGSGVGGRAGRARGRAAGRAARSGIH